MRKLAFVRKLVASEVGLHRKKLLYGLQNSGWPSHVTSLRSPLWCRYPRKLSRPRHFGCVYKPLVRLSTAKVWCGNECLTWQVISLSRHCATYSGFFPTAWYTTMSSSFQSSDVTCVSPFVPSHTRNEHTFLASTAPCCITHVGTIAFVFPRS